MILVLPIAGNSSRFPGVKPKWMLRHPRGKIMLAAGCDGLSPLFIEDKIERVVIILRETQVSEYGYAKQLATSAIEEIFPHKPVHTYTIPDTRNQPETLYRGLRAFFGEHPGELFNSDILVKDCDNYYSLNYPFLATGNAVLYGNLSRYPGVTAQDKSYITLDATNYVTNLSEKHVTSDHFCVSYQFDSAQRYLRLYEDLPVAVQTDPTLYLSDVIYNDLLQGSTYLGVPVSDYLDWGTADKWQTYLNTFSTLFLDLDGVVWRNTAPDYPPLWECAHKLPLVDNVAFLRELYEAGRAYLVLTTSRPETMREVTKQQLSQLGIYYHKLIMGLPHSVPRILVNDSSGQTHTAIGHTLQRDWDGQLRALLAPTLLPGGGV